MTLFNALDPTNKSPKENWGILNQLDRKITLRRIDATVTQLTGVISFYLLMILSGYTLFLQPFVNDLSESEQLLLANTAILRWAEMLAYPWYILLVGAVVLVLIAPCVLALLAKGLVYLLVPRLLRGKKVPSLPTEEIQQKKLLTLRTRYLYDRQYHSNGPNWDMAISIVAAVLFAGIPLLLSFTTEIGRGAVGTEVQKIILSVLAIVVTAFVFWFASVCLFLLLDKILSPLYRGRHWVNRYTALEKAGEAFYEQWVAVDPEEQENKKRRDEAEARKREEQKRKDEQARQWMVQSYLRWQKEHDDYMRRLHKWATEDDDINWTGSGDGI